MIKISKLNECFLQLSGDYGELETIYEAFSIYAPNYFWNPKYKSGYWDGKIKYFNKIDGTLPYGLFDELIKILKKYDIECTLSEKLLNDLSDKEITDFEEYAYKNLNPKFEPRYYQIEAAKKALTTRRALFEHATSSGKTLTLFLIINYIYNKYIINKEEVPYKLLFIVPDISLIKQGLQDFEEYGMDMKAIGVYYGQEKNIEPPIIIGTWQSLCKNKELLKKTAFVATDECHKNSAQEIDKLLKNCKNAKIRLGFTGTLPDEKVNLFTIIGNIGPVASQVKTKKLIKEGTVTDIKINILNLIYNKETLTLLKKSISNAKKILKDEYKQKILKKYKGRPNEIKYYLENPLPSLTNKLKRIKYEFEKKFIQVYSKRKQLVSKLINKHDGDTILLIFNEKKLGKNYLKYLKEKFPNKHFLYVDGDISGDDREAIRQRAIKEKGIIIVASLGTYSTGISIPRLKVIISLWMGKSKIKLLQTIGRALRLHKEKDFSILYDLNDQLPYAKKHGIVRLETYMKEGFDKIFTYDIKL